jgi:glycosyltransferase involved in cell wall biosynthesis
MKKINNICFQTCGGVNHDYGGLDRVTEILADYFEGVGYGVFYLSQLKRPNTINHRQVYLPNANRLLSRENILFYKQFLEENEIDVIINQEGNVNIHIPYTGVSRNIIYITALHFNPKYITDDYFQRKFKKIRLPLVIKNVLLNMFKVSVVKKTALKYLYLKLKRNYSFHCKSSDAFLLLSNNFKKDLALLFKNQLLPDNVYAINNPIVFSKSDVVVTQKKKQLLYVGRLECGMKRLDKLLANWSQIADRFPDWTLHLLGGGPDELELKKQVESNKIPRVFFEGIQNPIQYYKKASIFCFSSSSSEGWGMVLVEAQIHGCVPLAFESYASITDIVQHEKNGILVSPYDDAIYIKQLERLMKDDSLRCDLAQNAMQIVRKFDVNVIGKQWEKLIYNIYNSKIL